MGQIHSSSPAETSPHSKPTTFTGNSPQLHLGGDTEDWVIVERCVCGETCYFPSESVPPGQQFKSFTLTSEQKSSFLATEVPQPLVPVEYNLTAEVTGSIDRENPVQPQNKIDEITTHGNNTGDVLFQVAKWGYFGVRWMIQPALGLVDDMVATLENGMGI